jgi:hypothetical protein
MREEVEGMSPWIGIRGFSNGGHRCVATGSDRW